jgi:hypothetical protein
MRFLKKLPMTLGSFFLFLGALLLFADLVHIHRYGIDIFSGSQYVDDDGQIADCPVESGFVPDYVFIPIYIYALGCWVIAAIAFAFLPLTYNNVSRQGSAI